MDERGEVRRGSTDDITRVAVAAVALAVPVAVVSLASAGWSWRTRSGAGAFGARGGWALLLAASGVVAVAVGWPPSSAVAPARRRQRSIVALAIGGLAAAGSLAAAVARCVDALADDTTVADLRPSAAGWAAPVALVVAAVALGAVTRGRVRVVVGAVALASVAVGGVWGLRRPAVPVGVLSNRALDRFAGSRPRSVSADVIAAVGGTIYTSEFGRLAAIDGRGRWFPWASGDDLRPDGYVGHISDRSADTVSGNEPVALFARHDGLGVATDEAVFVVRPDGTSRLLVTLRHDRTAASLAELAARPSPVAVLDDATSIRGAGGDGAGGLIVVTDRAIVHVLDTAAVRPVPAGSSILGVAAAPGRRRLGVQARPDGSIVVTAPCRYWEISPDGATADQRGDWVGASCEDDDPVPVAVRGSDGLVVGIARDGSTVPVERFADTPLAESTRAVFDDRGYLVVVDADGVLRRTEVGS